VVRVVLKITAVSQAYLDRNQHNVQIMQRGYGCLDTGINENLLETSQFIAALDNRQVPNIACLEEIAWRFGWKQSDQLKPLAQPLKKKGYGRYLMRLLQEKGVC